MNKYGSHLAKHRGIAGFKGFKDEVSFLKPLMQKLNDSSHPIAHFMKKGFELFLNPWAGHSTLLVLRMNKE
jgi:hypothetical protein